jgi:glycine oxidase
LGYDNSPTAGDIQGLLNRAIDLAPGIAEMPTLETWAGLRPTTPDDLPIISSCEVEGLIIPTGHHKKGILLAPITANSISTMIDSGDPPPAITPFSLSRFPPPEDNER